MLTRRPSPATEAPNSGHQNDTPLPPHARQKLEEISRELSGLREKADQIDDHFLAFLITSAEDEARDQLRDDLILRHQHEPNVA